MGADDHDFAVLGDDDLRDFNAAGDIPEPPETVLTIQQWLQPTDYAADSSEYQKHLNSYVAGTGNWIQETKTYQTWHNSPKSSSLWIKAIPGAGKSVFAAMLAAKLAKTEMVPVLYFFFRQIIAKNHDPQFLVRDWLSQLLPYSPALQSKLKRDVEDNRNLDDISVDELRNTMLSAVTSMPKVYCVVDALDEMDIGKVDLLNHLVELGKQENSIVKVLMTSRPLPYIEAVLRTPSILQIPILQIRLQQNMVDTDIAIYVEHRLRDHDYDSMTGEVRQAIRSSICRKGRGSFLYARLMMDNLLDNTKQKSVSNTELDRTLEKLPVSLEEMYNGMLLEHSTRSGVPQELQFKILQWVTHSVRPLRLLELAAMLDFLDGNRKANDTKAVVRAACGPLLEILEDETVSIIHHSFTEFLMDSERKKRVSPGQFPVIDSQEAHRVLALTCLMYLTSGRLAEWKLGPKTDAEIFRLRRSGGRARQEVVIKMRNPFLDYAARNLCAHVAELKSSDESLFSALDEFMKPENHAFHPWLDFVAVWKGNKKLERICPLHVAAFQGMANYCQHLIQLGQDLNNLDGHSRTPLHWASQRGHADVVAILLENKANADPDDDAGLKPIHLAAQANHFAVVRLLLAAGVKAMTPKTKEYPGHFCGNTPTTVGETAPMYACKMGCVETIAEFMKYLNAKELDQCLCWAAEAGYADVVSTLLDSPDVSVDTTEDEARNTPLFLAAKAQNPAVIRALLQKGADPNARSANILRNALSGVLSFGRNAQKLGPTPLHALAGLSAHRRRSPFERETVLKECFELLVDAGADLNAKAGGGMCPIHYSTTSPTITSMLLQHGADARVESDDGSTPLHFVCNTAGDGEIIDLLVPHNADVNAKRHDGKTPLHLMLEHSHSLVGLKRLLAYKPDVNAQDEKGDTPLHTGVRRCNKKETIAALLEAGADPNKQNSGLETPIQLLGQSSSDFDKLVMLINAGADLEARDNLGRTALLRNLPSLELVKKLLELGAKVDARDEDGNSALHLVCGMANTSLDSLGVLKVLVDAGADPKWVNHEGNTAIHEAARPRDQMPSKYKNWLELLLELGAPARQKNHLGGTALHVLCATGSPSAQGRIILDLLLGPKFGIGINEGDNNGIRPIHLAASKSAELVGWLVDAGADPTVRTIDDQTPLQVACRARESNIVGMLLEIYQARKESNMIDWTDKRGRTALHDACRSGRPESVKLLLTAGADPKAKDNEGLTPLHACAEFPEENLLWFSKEIETRRDAVTARRPSVDPVSVLISDERRPCQSRHSVDFDGENETVRIRQSIRLLLTFGADLTALSNSASTPFDIAESTGCKVMVDELLPAMQQIHAKNNQPLDGRGTVDKELPKSMQDLVKDCAQSYEWSKLLQLDDELLFDMLLELQIDLVNFPSKETLDDEETGYDELAKEEESASFSSNHSNRPESLPETLVKWGYAELLQKFGPQVSSFEESARIGKLTPLLHLACQRKLLNLDVVKILVDKLGVNIYALNMHEREAEDRETALHVLATGQYWWQPQALDFLIQRGADTEIKNNHGETLLSRCVSDNWPNGYWKAAAADVLLKHGANPNSVDGDGLTCLNKAIPNVQLMRKLIEHGADVSFGETPPLFTAIDKQDVASVTTLLEFGADCNLPSDGVYPLHLAAWPGMYFTLYSVLPSERRKKRIGLFNDHANRSHAVPVVKLLLDKGADPYVVFNEETTILHDIFQRDGIWEPFLDLPTLDLEHRDPRGRTLLLAACRRPSRPRSHHHRGGEEVEDTKEPSLAEVLYRKGADLRARDAQGMNVLHHFLTTDKFKPEEFERTFTLFLKEAPALVHEKDLQGATPFHYAVWSSARWSAEALLQAGANPTEPDSLGNTALHLLYKCVLPSFLDLAVKEGRLLGSTPMNLDHAIKRGLAMGIPIDARNKAGETPLFSYVRKIDLLRVEVLELSEPFSIFTKAGADILAKNNDMETLLHIVVKKQSNFRQTDRGNKVECFKLLMGWGLDPLAEDVNQRTALDVAAACGTDGILKLFQRESES